MIKCPKCGSINSTAVETRNTESGRVRRRKHCNACGCKFTTYEVVMTEEEYENDARKRHELFLRSKYGRRREE